MHAQCRQYLIDKVKAATVKSVHTAMKKLKASKEIRIGGVIFEDEKFSRYGSKTIYRNDNGEQSKRTKIFDRDITYVVIIGEGDFAAAATIVESFISSIDRGIYIDGNFTGIELVEAEWDDDDDNILQAKVAVLLRIVFHGGVYSDRKYAPVHGYDVNINIKKGEESDNGE